MRLVRYFRFIVSSLRHKKSPLRYVGVLAKSRLRGVVVEIITILSLGRLNLIYLLSCILIFFYLLVDKLCVHFISFSIKRFFPFNMLRLARINFFVWSQLDSYCFIVYKWYLRILFRTGNYFCRQIIIFVYAINVYARRRILLQI